MHVARDDPTNVDNQVWALAQDLKISLVFIAEWNHFFMIMGKVGIFLNRDEEHSLSWSRNKQCGFISAKQGYNALIQQNMTCESKW